MGLRYIDPGRPATRPIRLMVRFGRSRPGQLFARHVAARTDVVLARASRGRLNSGMFSVPSATLTTTGAKTGLQRRVQIAYFHDGGDVIAIASNFGGDRHPAWYRNLVVHPRCTLGGERFTAREVTDPEEYDRLFGVAERYYGGYADYRVKTALTGRRIPILRFERRVEND
ncbi:nitroreductase/quinone reductase family protein [Mycobacterium sp. NPDC050041]|uniref:nitroreductase/quinone reductase family protein n=1 Tax=Mycobacterium sp. NPDC050041 TaxID=3364293 RepID=UPI003C2C6B6D